ncbi:hypothetical protein C0J52_15555 [Blattella germanica]|nr:hypothetical protein C0J52_15555 [Blattella germanica]
MNAKIGKEDEYKPCIGKYSLHENSNDNGIRLIHFSSSRNMVVGSTIFNHRDIHKMTWKSPDGNTFNQIDHILIDARHFSNLIDVRSYRGANIDSDHYLVVATIRGRISNVRKTFGSHGRKFNSNRLKEPETVERYANLLNEALTELPSSENVDESWKNLKETLLKTAHEVLGRIDRVAHNNWFDEECAQVTSLKNEAYKRMQQRFHTRKAVEEYRVCRREEKRLHKKKKREYEKKELEEMESLKGMNDVRAFYQKLNKSRKDFQPRTSLCRSKDGTILSSEETILERWTQHFDELLNEGLVNDHEILPSVSIRGLEIDVSIPTIEEVELAIKKLKNNKAPGIDLIQSELVKHAGKEFVKHFHKLITSIWETETIPDDWNVGIICPIHKKGDTMVCSNYRGISLLPIAYKVFSNILFSRLAPYVENVVGDYQCGFRQGRSTVDQIFTIRQILEKCKEFGIDTHHLFIDFRSAYDSIDRNNLYAAMEDLEIPKKLITLVKVTMENTQSKIKIQNKLSNPVTIKNGVRQGDSLSCLLFNIALEKVIRDAGINTRGTIFYKSVQILAYADDIDIIARTPRAMREAFVSFEKAARKMNLQINEGKTKYMPVTKKAPPGEPAFLEIGSYKFEIVCRFTYLGSEVNSRNNVSSEIQKRILSANKCYYGLRKHLKSKLLLRKTKVLMYKVLVKPVLIYGAETWVLSKFDERQLCIFERKILRQIFGPVEENNEWRRRYNHELYELYKGPDIVGSIKIQRLHWAGHVLRANDRMINKVFHAKPEGTRKVGRPKLRWEDGVREDVKTIGIRNWRSSALNREEWRKLLQKAKAHRGLSRQ